MADQYLSMTSIPKKAHVNDLARADKTFSATVNSIDDAMVRLNVFLKVDLIYLLKVRVMRSLRDDVISFLTDGTIGFLRDNVMEVEMQTQMMF